MGLTTITDTLYMPNGLVYTGRVTITLPASSSQPLYNSAGQSLVGLYKVITPVAGVIDVDLEANDAITPAGTSYTVRYMPSTGSPWTEYWTVPTSASPVTVPDCRATTVPSPTVTFGLTQISGASASEGEVIRFNGSSWARYALTDADGRVKTYKSTPASSAESRPVGSIWFDDTYLYVSTSSGLIKRVALGSF